MVQFSTARQVGHFCSAVYKQTKELPKILEFTTEIPAKLDIEFGYILNIKKGRGEKITFQIEHPPFKDSDGNIEPPFVGDVFVRTSDYNFFLGDTIWAPVEDKKGIWTLSIFWQGKTIAAKKFNISDIA